MSPRRLLALCGILFLGGCIYHARERVDETVCNLAGHPYDRQPEAPPSAVPDKGARLSQPGRGTDIQTTAFMQADQPARPADGKSRLELNIPPEIPGSETPRIELPKDPEAAARTIRRIYPKLPPLPAEPKALPGPGGNPYTLADLQQLAAANSPTLRQAASDVEAARGALIQARAYPNPTLSYQDMPSNDGSVAGVHGVGIDQLIKFGGKLKLAAEAAEMDLANAELALRRARSDLSTAVRNAYFAVLVAKETVRETKALARLTDDVYRVQGGYLAGGFAAPYEPAALRALAYTARLAYKQSIQTYIYSWKQLVAALGLRQLPLTEVAGRIDTVIPYFDYDAVREYVLRNHTDVLTARNGLDKARYNLKAAQITPYPDIDVNLAVLKETALAPKQWVHTLTVGIPIPIWDRNKGNIMSAEAALVRATEEPHRVEENLTTTLATAYMGYKTNLDALEYYRRYILPDQVRTYRGVFRRRQIDQGVALADLVGAEQTLVADVTSYLGILGSLWSSVVGVADLLQTDDLFQLAQPRAVPALPDLEPLPPWPCCHDCPPPGACHPGGCATGPAAPAPVTVQPAQPERIERLPPPTPARVAQPVAAQRDVPRPAAPPAAQPSGPVMVLTSEDVPVSPPETGKPPADGAVPQTVPER
jgi:cobalt-zinc-cadmium efflux system outer membrane protein